MQTNQTRVHCQSVERVFIFSITESYLRNGHDIRQKLSKIVYKIKHSVPCPKTWLVRNSTFDLATKTKIRITVLLCTLHHKKAQCKLVSPFAEFNLVHFSPRDTNSIWKTQFSREIILSTQPKVNVFFFAVVTFFFLLLPKQSINGPIK